MSLDFKMETMELTTFIRGNDIHFMFAGIPPSPPPPPNGHLCWGDGHWDM